MFLPGMHMEEKQYGGATLHILCCWRIGKGNGIPLRINSNQGLNIAI